MMFESVLFHIKSYWDFSVRMNRLPYVVIVVLHAVIMAPFLIASLPTEAEIAAQASDAMRAGFDERIVHFAYNLLLLPFHLKRLKDLGWSTWMVDGALLFIYVPSVLGTFMSEGGFNVVAQLVVMLGVPGAFLSIYLLLTRGTVGPNDYGEDAVKD